MKKNKKSIKESNTRNKIKLGDLKKLELLHVIELFTITCQVIWELNIDKNNN